MEKLHLMPAVNKCIMATFGIISANIPTKNLPANYKNRQIFVYICKQNWSGLYNEASLFDTKRSGESAEEFGETRMNKVDK